MDCFVFVPVTIGSLTPMQKWAKILLLVISRLYFEVPLSLNNLLLLSDLKDEALAQKLRMYHMHLAQNDWLLEISNKI